MSLAEAQLREAKASEPAAKVATRQTAESKHRAAGMSVAVEKYPQVAMLRSPVLAS
jgi:hypothetical protein